MIPRDGGAFTAAPQKLAMTASSVRSTRLAPGRYLLFAQTTAINFRQGNNAVVATANDHMIAANGFFWSTIVVGPSSIADADATCDGFIAAIAASGNLFISLIG